MEERDVLFTDELVGVEEASGLSSNFSVDVGEGDVDFSRPRSDQSSSGAV